MVGSVHDKLLRSIPEERLEQLCKEHAPGYRHRIYSPLVTLGLFLEQALHSDQACQDAVGRSLSQRTALHLSEHSLNTGPYCKARQRLSVELITALTHEIANATKARTRAIWRGREVKLIDGTTVSMPDTAANQAEFPQNRRQPPGLGFPLARVVGVISLATGSLLDWTVCACEGAGTAEPMQLRRMLDGFQAGDVVIADRGLAGYFLLAELHRRGIDFVMRDRSQHQYDAGDTVRLGRKDHRHVWHKPARPRWMDPATYAAAPDQLIVREVQDGSRRLVTSLINPTQAPSREIAWLYQQRWHIELDLRAIKCVMQMDILRCKTPSMVIKEIAVHLLAYNLIRLAIATAASIKADWPRTLSFAAARRALARCQETLRHRPNGHFDCAVQQLLRAISGSRIPYRPDRLEPRAIKRRPKPRPYLHRPRHEYRKWLHHSGNSP